MKTISAFFILSMLLLGLNSNSQEIIDNTVDLSTASQSKDVKIPFSASDAPGAPGSWSMCDDFNITNTSVIPGWTEQKGDWEIFDNKLKTPARGQLLWDFITKNGSGQTDGCCRVRAIYGDVTEVKFVGVIGRAQDSVTFILFKIQDNEASGYWNSYWVYNNRGYSALNIINKNFGKDAIIEMEYKGSNVTVRIDTDRDGTWDHTNTATVSNTNPGLCGIGGYNNAFADNFCAGSSCNFTPIPISNYALYVGFALMLIFTALLFYRRR